MTDTAVLNLFPRTWPVPPDWCEPCRGHAAERERASATGNQSLVSDMNVLIRRHHPQAKR